MLICLGGFLGSGRRILASKIAQKHGFKHYDIGSKKIHRSLIGDSGHVKDVVMSPNTDELRMLLYRKMVEELPVASKMYPDLIIDDAFHREEAREYFFSEAKKYFNRVVFVWIDSAEPDVAVRMQHMKEVGMIESVEGALLKRQRTAAKFQPLHPGVPVFTCVKGDDAEADALWQLIKSN